MGEIKLDISQLDRLDINKLGRKVKLGFAPQRAGGVQKPLLKTAVSAFSNNQAKELLSLTESRNYLTLIKPKKIPICVPSTSDITIAVGLAGGHQIIFGPVIGAGFYGSPTTGEIGWYSGMAMQIQSNIGFSGGIEVSYILGAPSVFSGTSYGIGIDATLVGIVTGTVMFLFATTGCFMGISLSIGAGLSVLPLNLTVQVSHTSTHAIVEAK